MSRKTIPFPVPKKAASAATSSGLATIFPLDVTKVDQWVAQKPTAPLDSEPLAPGATNIAAGLTIAISEEPEMFEIWKIGMFLPYALAWRWALGAANRSARIFAR